MWVDAAVGFSALSLWFVCDSVDLQALGGLLCLFVFVQHVAVTPVWVLILGGCFTWGELCSLFS